jgi:hypothetical protein
MSSILLAQPHVACYIVMGWRSAPSIQFSSLLPPCMCRLSGSRQQPHLWQINVYRTDCYQQIEGGCFLKFSQFLQAVLKISIKSRMKDFLRVFRKPYVCVRLRVLSKLLEFESRFLGRDSPIFKNYS